MKVSENGLNFTAAWEKFRSAPYFATEDERRRGIYTWGFGHTGRNPPRINITREAALAILREDLSYAEKKVNEWAHKSITQPIFDALVDLVINAGEEPIRPDKKAGDFDDLVTQGRWDELIVQLEFFRKQGGKIIPGLVRRALARQALAKGMNWRDAEAVGRNAKV
nr:MAG: lysozyme [Bacteriophage sp.]